MHLETPENPKFSAAAGGLAQNPLKSGFQRSEILSSENKGGVSQEGGVSWNEMY